MYIYIYRCIYICMYAEFISRRICIFTYTSKITVYKHDTRFLLSNSFFQPSLSVA